SCQNFFCTCPDGTTDCGDACVNTESDDNNCGACGIVCTGGKSCQNGVCTCPNGGTDCGGTCTNVLFDDARGGGWGNACDANQACFLGKCGCSDTTKLYCNGQCIDGFSDPNNCGNCGNVCPAGQDCVGGSCKPPCDQPCHGLVNNVCVSLCNTGEVCGPAGQCQLSCPAGYTPCGDQCVPTTPRGDGVCCQWQGNWHACAAGEQCAADGCCSAGDEVCVGNGSGQCCNGGFVCQAGRCCLPQPYPQCDGPGCCWWPH